MWPQGLLFCYSWNKFFISRQRKYISVDVALHSFQSKNWAMSSTSPANSSSTLTARTAETGFWSNEKRNTLVSLSPYRDDSFNTRNLSRTISSSISTPCTAESFTSSERRSTLVSLSPYTDETPVNSVGSSSTLMSPFTGTTRTFTMAFV
ncbi:uncharacterized protein LOC144618463 [Crassostrea virginica]